MNHIGLFSCILKLVFDVGFQLMKLSCVNAYSFSYLFPRNSQWKFYNKLRTFNYFRAFCNNICLPVKAMVGPIFLYFIFMEHQVVILWRNSQHFPRKSNLRFRLIMGLSKAKEAKNLSQFWKVLSIIYLIII